MQELAEMFARLIANNPSEKQLAILQKFQASLNSKREKSRAQAASDNFNALDGELNGLSGFDCEKCRNKGVIAYVADGDDCDFRTRECECMTRRRVLSNMRKSGLGDLLSIYTFDNYTTPNQWQKIAKSRALDYVTDFEKSADALKWLCVFGAVGSGKTHICTAVCNKILENGGKVVYMLWREESVRLKAAVNDFEEYKRLFAPFKEADVLYIDDFLKGKKGQSPTDADITLAFELINHRYYMPNTRTIISSEKSFEELIALDEAVGSRISQRCGEKYRVLISQGEDKNWRLRA